MKSAEGIAIDIFYKSGMNYSETDAGYKNLIEACIQKGMQEAIIECCNKARTYKVGNSGSWYDAAVDKSILINLLKEIK